MKEIREQIIAILEKQILDKHRIISDDILSMQDAAAGEQKSSAGDKHETSREMMRQELDLLQKNLNEINKEIQELEFLKNRVPTQHISAGSLVITTKGYFFLTSLSGKITFNDNKVVCVSPASPFAKVILNLKPESDFSF